jgi:hypothetical protein
MCYQKGEQMKTLTFLLLTSFITLGYSKECTTEVKENVEVVDVQSKDDAAKYLKEAKIIVKLANGKEYAFNANEFKVVPRSQLKKVTQVTKEKLVSCTEAKDENKNLLLGGLRRDIKDVNKAYSSTSSSQTLRISSEKGLIPEAGYMRRKVIGNVGVGGTVDSEGTGKLLIGLEF